MKCKYFNFTSCANYQLLLHIQIVEKMIVHSNEKWWTFLVSILYPHKQNY